MPSGRLVATRIRRSVVFVTLLLILALLFSPFSDILEHFAYDALFWMRQAQPPHPGIRVVAIDEESFQVVQKPWPWPRSKHAELIRALFHAGARAVAFDVVFADPSSPVEDLALREALLELGPVVLASDYDLIDDPRFARETLVLPNPQFITPNVKTGYVNYPLDADTFLRRLKIRSAPSQPFAWEAAHAFREKIPPPSETTAELLINFSGPARNISTVSYYQALEPSQYLPPNFFRDKLVFVGLSTSSTVSANINTRDHYPTPFSRWGGQPTAGVEVHAAVAANFLENNFVSEISPPLLMGLAILCAGGYLILLPAVVPIAGFAITVTGMLAVIVASYLLFLRAHIYLAYSVICCPILISYISSLFSHYLSVRQERNFIRKTFSHYVSPGVVAELLRHPDKLMLGGTRVNGTVMFIDIAGFTSFSERLSPEQLINVLNRNMGALSDIIISNLGMVDKYIGDSIMAVWGAPLPDQNHAQEACRAALIISETIRVLSKEEISISGIELGIRIGINSGEMVAGNIGGQHVNYTVLGNTVNFASRIEGVNRKYQTTILVGELTASLIGSEFVTRYVDTLRVKGQTKPSKIFELLAVSSSASATIITLCTKFNAARECYIQKQWQQAFDTFSKLLEEFPGDGPSHTLQQRCREFLANPPPQDWDGVYDMETK